MDLKIFEILAKDNEKGVSVAELAEKTGAEDTLLGWLHLLMTML